MPSEDTSNIILSIWAANKPANEAFELEHNKDLITKSGEPEELGEDCRSKRQPTPDFPTPCRTEMVLRTNDKPKDPSRGWCFGSDAEECDGLLDESNRRGVSGVHFEVNLNWKTFAVVISNKSNNPLTIKLPNQDLDPFGRDEKRALPDEPCLVLLGVGLLQFMLQVPERKDRAAYEVNLRAYGEMAQMEMPSISRLNFRKRVNPTPVVAVNRYIPERIPLGKGSHGKVYAALDGYSGDKVALKYFHSFITSKEIESEIEVHKILRHDNIIRFVDYVPSDRFVVLEHAADGTFSGLGSVSRTQLYHLSLQMTSALSYLHAKSITHRDVKPANILLHQLEPIVGKLSDFSSATDVVEPSGYCGTDLYRAPEVSEIGQAPYSSVIDVFSLSVLIIEKWYDWFPDFVFGLSIPGRDTFLPETWREPEDGVKDTATRNVTRMRARAKLGERRTGEKRIWSDELRDKWIELMRAKLEKEMVLVGSSESCHMAQLFLRMFEPDPQKRWQAKVCHSYLEKQREHYPVVAEPESTKLLSVVADTAHRPFKKSRRHGSPEACHFSEEQREQYPIVADSESTVGIDAVAAPRRIRRNSNYQRSKVALPGDKRELASPIDQNPTAIQSSDSAVLAIVHLYPEEKEINANDLMRASNRPPYLTWPRSIGRWDKSKGRIISYEHGKEFILYLGFSDENIRKVENAMMLGTEIVWIRREITTLNKDHSNPSSQEPVHTGSLVNPTQFFAAGGLSGGSGLYENKASGTELNLDREVRWQMVDQYGEAAWAPPRYTNSSGVVPFSDALGPFQDPKVDAHKAMWTVLESGEDGSDEGSIEEFESESSEESESVREELETSETSELDPSDSLLPFHGSEETQFLINERENNPSTPPLGSPIPDLTDYFTESFFTGDSLVCRSTEL